MSDTAENSEVSVQELVGKLQDEVRRQLEIQTQLRTEQAEIVKRGEIAINAANAREKATRDQFGDLKKRVHDLEIENATMPGYLNRVQEDDEVREELITVGEPGGEQHLTPKRKPRLHRMYTSAPSALYDSEQMHEPWRERPKSKHWVNY